MRDRRRRLTIQPADPNTTIAPTMPNARTIDNPAVVAIGDELTSDEQALLLVMHVAEQTSNVFHQAQALAAGDALGCRAYAGVVAQANDFVGELRSPDARAWSAPGCGAAVGDCLPSASRSPPALAGAVRKTLSVGREKSVVADEYETAIPDLDVLHRRSKFGDPLDDFVGVPDPAGRVPRRDRASVRHRAQREEQEDRDTESQLQSSTEMDAQSLAVIVCEKDSLRHPAADCAELNNTMCSLG